MSDKLITSEVHAAVWQTDSLAPNLVLTVL